MAGVTSWSTNPDYNTVLDGVSYWPAGMYANAVDNTGRQMMADIKLYIGGGIAVLADLLAPTAGDRPIVPSSIAAATAYIPITYASSMTLDLTKGYNFLVNLTGNATLTLGTGSAAPPASRYGSSGVIEVRATGGFTLTLSGVKGIATVPPSASTYYVLGYVVDSTGAVVVTSMLGPYSV